MIFNILQYVDWSVTSHRTIVPNNRLVINMSSIFSFSGEDSVELLSPHLNFPILYILMR